MNRFFHRIGCWFQRVKLSLCNLRACWLRLWFRFLRWRWLGCRLTCRAWRRGARFWFDRFALRRNRRRTRCCFGGSARRRRGGSTRRRRGRRTWRRHGGRTWCRSLGRRAHRADGLAHRGVQLAALAQFLKRIRFRQDVSLFFVLCFYTVRQFQVFKPWAYTLHRGCLCGRAIGRPDRALWCVQLWLCRFLRGRGSFRSVISW